MPNFTVSYLSRTSFNNLHEDIVEIKEESVHIESTHNFVFFPLRNSAQLQLYSHSIKKISLELLLDCHPSINIH